MKLYAFVLGGLILALTYCAPLPKKEINIQDYLIPQDEPLPELSIFNLPTDWINHKGDSVKLGDFQGKLTVMTMIYTSCKAACPRLTADMSQISKSIPVDLLPFTQFVFVSIDPLVDTPENMSTHLASYQLTQDYWHFLRGTVQSTREFSMILGVKYKQITPIDFSHSNIISLFDESGILVHQQVGLGVDNQEIIDRIKELGEKYLAALNS
jgi:protein SCO1/2